MEIGTFILFQMRQNRMEINKIYPLLGGKGKVLIMINMLEVV